MRRLVLASWLLLCPMTAAVAQVSVQIGLPNASIGINVPVYPRLVAVPGYPVYYAPNLAANYFFYDGMYWVFQGDNWYVSSWYNGPWSLVSPEAVPLYVLRVPVRYYRRPPPYFRPWLADAPPRWGMHFGHEWEERHHGWDKWNRHTAPPRAPLPVYQKQYAGERYPHGERQPGLYDQHYRYRPRDAAVRQAYEAHGMRGSPPPPSEKKGHGQGQHRGEERGPGRDR